MWPFEKTQQYQQVVDQEQDKNEESASHSHKQSAHARHIRLLICIVVGLLVCLGIGGVVITSHLGFVDETTAAESQLGQDGTTKLSNSTTDQPACPKRREWRSLSSKEQQEYISAVLCLKDRPSKLSFSANGTSYDDFPWIHSHVGYYTHNSAPFLPWHRYFLHIYESTLRNSCGYDGSLVYWDWTLDSDALEKSPIFSVNSGFGGDGETDGAITVGRSGRCVIDGPFSHVTADYYDVKFKPHCLSRGFRDREGNLGHIDGGDITPDSIEEVLAIGNYEEFVALMESRVHDAIPFGIGGDFETFTAPYDPIFFLHHTQLDRLWWLWQQKSEENVNEYGGHKHRHSIELASLTDKIEMQGLALPITVSQVMNTEGELLCYSY